jgi:hypothetical protein
MKKKQPKKLAIHRETLHSLEREDLEKAAGDGNPTQQSRCKSCISECCA